MEMGEFTIEITKDVGGSEIAEHSMSLRAANSLKVILESLTEVATMSGGEDSNIKIDTGTTKISIKANQEQLDAIDKNLTDVSEGKSNNERLMTIWKKVHSTISANSLEYSASFHSVQNTKDITTIFKDKKKFKKTVVKRPIVRFYIGKLRGLVDNEKSSTITIELNEEERYGVNCEATDTFALNNCFSHTIYISVIETIKGDKVTNRTLCNFYTQDFYNEIYSFYNECKRLRGIEKLKFINKTIDSIIRIGNDFSKVAKYVKLFNHTDEDVSVLRMLINTIQNIENQEEILKIKESLIQKTEKRIGSIY